MRRILIIEDEALVAALYVGLFESAGYTVEVATDGPSGLQKILATRPDGLLLDLMLPQLNGLDILREIRTNREFDRMVIIVFTNSYVTQMLEGARNAGANRVFHKSQIRPRDILAAMAELLPEKPATTTTRPPVAPQPPRPLPSTARAGGPPVPSATAPPSAPIQAPGGAPMRTQTVVADAPNELVRNLLPSVPEMLNALHAAAITLPQRMDDASRRAGLLEFYRKLHGFSGICGMAGMRPLADLATAVEALIIELHQDPARLNGSTCRTLLDTALVLQQRFNPGATPPPAGAAGQALVLDDDLMSRRATMLALQKANLEVTDLENPQNAIELTRRRKFDLLVVTMDSPRFRGEEFLAQTLALTGATRVPFIGAMPLADLATRPPWNPDLGEDYIGKPFPLIELTVKAMACLLRRAAA